MSVNRQILQKRKSKTLRWNLTVLSLLLSGCAEDPFSDDPINNPSYPDLNHLNIPDSTIQPHSVFNTTAAVEQSINASRQRETILHKQLWEAAQQQISAQTPIENSIP